MKPGAPYELRVVTAASGSEPAAACLTRARALPARILGRPGPGTVQIRGRRVPVPAPGAERAQTMAECLLLIVMVAIASIIIFRNLRQSIPPVHERLHEIMTGEPGGDNSTPRRP